MKARILVPVLLALATVAGLMFGGILPAGGLLGGTPAAADDRTAPNGEKQVPSASPIKLTVGTTSPPKEQPQATLDKLEAGKQPPQFVVVSFDGSCETKDKLFRHWLDTADKVDGRFTFNISGTCIIPDDQRRMIYSPPQKPQGTSDIGFGDISLIPDRINAWSEAYNKGHEMATHYMGHFCGNNGVKKWTTADWSSEIAQFNKVLTEWPTINDQIRGVNALPFDTSVIKGGRTPCLEGDRAQMYPAMTAAGYTYETSNDGKLAWPKKVAGQNIWDFPLQAIKMSGTNIRTLSMDYNFLANQNGGKTQADPAKCQQIEQQTYQSLMDAGEAVYTGNRAPLFVGNHFNNWACGAYKNSLTRFIVDFKAKHPDVQFISNSDLEKWLEAQDPVLIGELQARPIQQY